MTKKELIEQLESIPDNTIICNIDSGNTWAFEVTSIEFINKAKYVDADDEETVGDIVIL